MRATVMTAALLSSLASGSVSASDGQSVALHEPALLTVDEIQTPIFGASRIEGTLNLALAVEASDKVVADQLRDKMPLIRSALLASSIEYSRLHVSGLAPVNAERLNAALNASVKGMSPGIERVLLLRVSASPT